MAVHPLPDTFAEHLFGWMKTFLNLSGVVFGLDAVQNIEGGNAVLALAHGVLALAYCWLASRINPEWKISDHAIEYRMPDDALHRL